MGWNECPGYKQYFLLYGHYCDDISCADCPIGDWVRKMIQEGK